MHGHVSRCTATCRDARSHVTMQVTCHDARSHVAMHGHMSRCRSHVTMHGHMSRCTVTCHDARSHVAMHGHMSRCTVTCHDARSHERKKHQLLTSVSHLLLECCICILDIDKDNCHTPDEEQILLHAGNKMFRSILGAAVIPATQYINKTTYTSFNTAVFERLSSIGNSFVVLRRTINRQ